MKRQLKEWEGKFGDEYTDRNVVDGRARLPLFRRMLNSTTLHRVLEVGCNRGHNLMAISELLDGRAELVGIEPNPHARALARSVASNAAILAGVAYDLPFKERTFDLAFTWGVLIHVPLEALGIALEEVYRVTRRYILAVEYFAEEETRISYRGHADLLWKRDFLRHYQQRFPNLALLRGGFWGPNDGADGVNWWLLERRPPAIA